MRRRSLFHCFSDSLQSEGIALASLAEFPDSTLGVAVGDFESVVFH